MSKLWFRHGVMDSSKSANMLIAAHNYEKQNKKVIVLKPSTDTRSSFGKIESRLGISRDCLDISSDYDITTLKNIDEFSCIFVDEAHFLTKSQVKDLTALCDTFKIPVICYGLKNSYSDGELFEGSAALLYYADKIEEIKHICSDETCNKKATMNLRIKNGKAIYSGELINCGDTEECEDYYLPVCREHYYNTYNIIFKYLK